MTPSGDRIELVVTEITSEHCVRLSFNAPIEYKVLRHDVRDAHGVKLHERMGTSGSAQENNQSGPSTERGCLDGDLGNDGEQLDGSTS